MFAACPRYRVLDVTSERHPQEVLDGGDRALHGVRPFADVEPLAAVLVAVACDEHLRLDLAEPVQRAFDAEVRGAGRPHGTDACRCQHRDNRLRDIGKPARDAVPGRDPEVEERLPECGGRGGQFPVAEGPALAVLEHRDDRHRVVAVAKEVLGEVQPGAGKPPATRELLPVLEHRRRTGFAHNVAEIPDRLPELPPVIDGETV